MTFDLKKQGLSPQNQQHLEVSNFILQKLSARLPFREFIRFFDSAFFQIVDSKIICICQSKEIATAAKVRHKKTLVAIFEEIWSESSETIVLSFAYFEQDHLVEIENVDNLIFFEDSSAEYSFENFVHSEENITSYKTLRSICCASVDEIPAYDSIFYIHAESGNGKTHLLQATHKYYLSKKGASFYISGNEFLKQYIASIQAGGSNAFYRAILNNDIIIIDSIDEIIGKRATMSFLSTIAKECLIQKKYIIISGKLPLSQLSKDLHASEICRSAIDFAIHPPSQALKRKIAISRLLSQKSKLSLMLIDEVIDHLGKTCRDVKNSINKLIIEQDSILNTLSVKEVLFKLGKISKSPFDIKDMDPVLISENVSRQYNLTLEDLRSQSKTKNIYRTRHILMFIMHKYRSFSYSEISRLLHKNHSTVISGIRKIEDEVANNKHLLSEIISLMEVLK